MFTWVDKTMYIVKDDVGTVIAVFDTEKKANKFAKKNKNYYVDEAVKYDYKDFYYKEVQAVTVRVVATRFDKRTPAPQAHGFNHGLGAANK